MTLRQWLVYRSLLHRARKVPLEEQVAAGVGLLERIEAAETVGGLILPPEAALQDVCARAAASLGVDSAFFTVVDAERQVLHAGINAPVEIGQPIPLKYSVCVLVAAHDRPVVVADVRTEPGLRSCVLLGADMAYAGVPVHYRGQAIGALAAKATVGHEWPARTVEVLTPLSRLIEENIMHRTPTGVGS